MKFTIVTEGGSEIEMKAGTEIEVEINGVLYRILIQVVV